MLRLVKPYALQRLRVGQVMRTLPRCTAQWDVLSTLALLRALKNHEEVRLSSLDYQMYSGFVMMAS